MNNCNALNRDERKRTLLCFRKRISAGKSRLISAILHSFIPSLFIVLSSCKPSPQYQDHYNIPNAQWAAAFQPTFKFQITDTTAAYQLFLLIRHTDAYPFSNIWLNMDSKGPHDSAFKKLRVEVPLATTNGQWLGRGMGEIWEQRVPINSLQMPAFFPHKGLYTLRLTHEMRRDPLPEVLTIGLRLEKLPPFRKEKE